MEKKKYDVESLILRNVIATFTGSLAEAITLIHGVPFVKALEETQDRFDVLRKQQLDEEVALDVLDTASELRKDVEKGLRSLFSITTALFEFNKDPAFEQSILATEGLIKKL